MAGQNGECQAGLFGLRIIAGCVVCVEALIACGGTTGREGLPSSAQTIDSGLDAGLVEGGADAMAADATTSSGDEASDLFDSTIQYVDRALPDVVVVQAGDGGDGGAMLSCAPDIPGVYAPDGSVQLLLDGGDNANTEVPAIFAGDAQAPAPPGSGCGTQVWLGSEACDQCLRDQAGGVPGDPWTGEFGSAELPPCSDLVGAGAASVGMGAGQSRYQLCVDLVQCMLASHCATDPGLNGCICTLPQVSSCVSQGGSGPCLNQALAAAELTGGSPGDQFLQLTKQSGNTGTVVGHGWGSVSKLAKDAFSYCHDLCPFTNALPDAGRD